MKYAHENMIIIFPVPSCPDSAGARKGAKGSRKGGVRAVLGYHDFEQPDTFHIIPYYCIVSSLYPHVVFKIIIYGIIHYITSLSQLFRYYPDDITLWQPNMALENPKSSHLCCYV